jgi:hypothetical protein
MRVDASLSVAPNWLALEDIVIRCGTIIHREDLQETGATAAQKESARVIECLQLFVLTFSIPRGAFP